MHIVNISPDMLLGGFSVRDCSCILMQTSQIGQQNTNQSEHLCKRKFQCLCVDRKKHFVIVM